jgi:hypothetical protein
VTSKITQFLALLFTFIATYHSGIVNAAEHPNVDTNASAEASINITANVPPFETLLLDKARNRYIPLAFFIASSGVCG